MLICLYIAYYIFKDNWDSYLAGGNFPRWIIKEYLLNETLIPVCNNWEENLLMLRYDDEVLIHDFS